MTKFIFDLDGTVTSKETLPLIASHFGIEAEMYELTKETIAGNIPFIESFIRRVFILGKLPISEISDLLKAVTLYKNVVTFIKENINDCVIATGNLRCWTENLLNSIDCKYYCSDCSIKGNKVNKLTSILKKEDVVKLYKSNGERVIFIGDGNNDAEAMRIADVSIASGLTHYPAKSVLATADYLIFNEDALCRQLTQLL